MHNRLVSPIGPIVRSHCALCLASATDRRRPSGMGIAVYTAAASNMPPRRPASPTRSRLSQLRWSFVTCDQAHFAGKVLVESCFSQLAWKDKSDILKPHEHASLKRTTSSTAVWVRKTRVELNSQKPNLAWSPPVPPLVGSSQLWIPVAPLRSTHYLS
jgi:hypothetical protein